MMGARRASNSSERYDWGVMHGAVYCAPEDLKALEEERDRAKTRSFKLASGVAATVLGVMGAILVARADFPHAVERTVGHYNASVQDWKNEYRPRLASTRWQLHTQHLTLDLTPDTQEEQIENVEMTVEGYIPLQFRLPDLRQLLLPPTNHLEEGLSEKMLQETQNVSLRATSPSGEVSDIHLGSFALLNVQRRDSGSWKTCMYQEHGYWGEGFCTSYSVVDSVCVKVAENSTHPGLWSLDTSFGGEGCDPLNAWQALHIIDLPAPSDGSTPLPTSSGPLVVRSRYDPRIVALNMTEGTLFFAGDEASEMIVGWILLSLACVIMLPTLLLSLPALLSFLRDIWQAHVLARNGYQRPSRATSNIS